MPSERTTFTPSSILFRPRQSPPEVASRGWALVEAPGTAPGSASAITYALYRHSRFPDAANIGALAARRKCCGGGEDFFLPPGLQRRVFGSAGGSRDIGHEG